MIKGTSSSLCGGATLSAHVPSLRPSAQAGTRRQRGAGRRPRDDFNEYRSGDKASGLHSPGMFHTITRRCIGPHLAAARACQITQVDV